MSSRKPDLEIRRTYCYLVNYIALHLIVKSSKPILDGSGTRHPKFASDVGEEGGEPFRFSENERKVVMKDESGEMVGKAFLSRRARRIPGPFVDISFEKCLLLVGIVRWDVVGTLLVWPTLPERVFVADMSPQVCGIRGLYLSIEGFSSTRYTSFPASSTGSDKKGGPVIS